MEADNSDLVFSSEEFLLIPEPCGKIKEHNWRNAVIFSLFMGGDYQPTRNTWMFFRLFNVISYFLPLNNHLGNTFLSFFPATISKEILVLCWWFHTFEDSI